MRPIIDGTPGIVWRRYKGLWKAYWRARPDMVKKGFEPKSKLLWSGLEPTEIEAKDIADQCRGLQDEMLMFSRTGAKWPEKIVTIFDGTIRSLAGCYQTDPDSAYHKRRYHSRREMDGNLRRLCKKYGDVDISTITGRVLLGWHKDWVGPEGKIASAHIMMSLLRTLFNFGFVLLEDKECERVALILSKQKYENSPAREPILTADMVVRIREKAKEREWHYMALAQAIQFEAMMRQKDIIGEWVPLGEPGISDTFYTNMHGKDLKWVTGLRWEEIDQNFFMVHMTSKSRRRGKKVELSLLGAPMVMEDLANLIEVEVSQVTRDMFPAAGPVILCETNGKPYPSDEFRRKWRRVADKAGIPRTVKNMDSRAGAISEATTAGAPLEHVRHAATHSDIKMTSRYSRDGQAKAASVMEIRVKSRNKPTTE